MKKLKHLANEYISKNLDPNDPDSISHKSYIAGFKDAFKALNDALEEQKEELKAYPMLTERKQAINNIQKKLNELLVE